MESLLVKRWVYSVFAEDLMLSTGLPGGWQELPLEGTPTPWGRVESVGQAQDVRADEGAHLIWARPALLLTIFDRYGNYSRIEPLANRVYMLLHGQMYPELIGGTMFACIRDFASEGVENIGGQEVRRIFQQYSFYAADDNQP